MDVITVPGRVDDPPQRSALTIGAYDGVHLGHRALIAELRRLAALRECASVVVTFDRHPASVVRPESAPKLLTDLPQKLELLATTGIDAAVVVTFDETRAHEEAEEFVTEIVSQLLHAQVVVVGKDFHFGHNRRGNVELLRQMGPRLGFDVVGYDLVEIPGFDGPVSSTAVRRALGVGDVDEAARLLGRFHEVRGIVEGGERRVGSTELGFPTANVAVPAEILLPADGIYAGWYLDADGNTHAAAISLGRRPTYFGADAPRVLEAHVLDFHGDLYGQPARVQFVARLRDEERFESSDALAAQIERDVEATRAALAR